MNAMILNYMATFVLSFVTPLNNKKNFLLRIRISKSIVEIGKAHLIDI